MPSNSVCNHTCYEQVGFPLHGRPILSITRISFQSELDSTSVDNALLLLDPKLSQNQVILSCVSPVPGS